MWERTNGLCSKTVNRTMVFIHLNPNMGTSYSLVMLLKPSATNNKNKQTKNTVPDSVNG